MNIIKKCSSKKHFNAEIECYEKISQYDCFPSLISYDEDLLELELSFCGNNLTNNKTETLTIEDISKQVDYICDLLELHCIFYLDLKPDNICVKDKKIYLIDFGVSCTGYENEINLRIKIKHQFYRKKTLRLYREFLKLDSYSGFRDRFKKLVIKFLANKKDCQTLYS